MGDRLLRLFEPSSCLLVMWKAKMSEDQEKKYFYQVTCKYKDKDLFLLLMIKPHVRSSRTICITYVENRSQNEPC